MRNVDATRWWWRRFSHVSDFATHADSPSDRLCVYTPNPSLFEDALRESRFVTTWMCENEQRQRKKKFARRSKMQNVISRLVSSFDLLVKLYKCFSFLCNSRECVPSAPHRRTPCRSSVCVCAAIWCRGHFRVAPPSFVIVISSIFEFNK